MSAANKNQAMLACAIAALCGLGGGAAWAKTEALGADLERERLELRKDYEKRLAGISERLLGQTEPSSAGAATGAIRLPFLTADIDEGAKALHQLTVKEGAVIVEILNPRLSGDLAVGDAVIRFDGISIKSAKHLNEVVAHTPDLNSVAIRIDRHGVQSDHRLRLHADHLWIPFVATMSDTELSSEEENGVVGLSPMLLNFVESDDELAFLMAHEIGHVVMTHRRTLAHDTRADATQAVADAIVGGVFQALTNTAAPTVLPTHHYMLGPYGEVDETVADEYALMLMKRAGYDPQAAYNFLVKYEAEVAKTNNAYSKTYSQIHPVNVNRLAQVKALLADGALDAKIHKDTERRALGATRDFVIPDDAELGAVSDAGVDQGEFRVREVMMWRVYEGVPREQTLTFDADETDSIRWRALIDDEYQLFESSGVRLDLISSSGAIIDSCSDYYIVNSVGPSVAECEIKLKKIDPSQRPGVWTIKTYRGKTLIDVRNIYFFKKNRALKFQKRRSAGPSLVATQSLVG